MGVAASAPGEVVTLLGRAVRAGLSVGWVGLAVRESGGGVCWCTGTRSVGGEAVEADLRYDLASITKPLATAALLLLAQRDGLDLEAPLGGLLPELAGSPWAAVSLVRCATHTAGFPAWAPLYAAHGASREGYLEALRHTRPLSAPGLHAVYSCLGFVALGFALERGFGSDLATLFSELVAEPLGLADELGFAPPPATPTAAGERRWLVEQSLLVERGLSGQLPPAQKDALPCSDGNARGLGGAAGNAGLFGTAAAVARLAAEFLPGGGGLLTAEEAESATACRTAGLEQARGLGWQLASTPGCSAGPALPAGAFGHTGFTGTSVWMDPETRAGYVLLGNRLHPGSRTPDLHPLRRRFHALARRALHAGEGGAEGPNL
jgi:CubicO group peptidase (beta-lactamase class C family)